MIVSSPEISVVGCGAVSALGMNVSEVWSGIRNNRSGLTPWKKDGSGESIQVGRAPDAFWAEEGATDDHAFRLALRAVEEAGAHARNSLNGLDASRIGLVLATTKANITCLERMVREVPVSREAERHMNGLYLARDLAQQAGALGPVQAVSVACASGLLALQQGAVMIRNQRAEAVYVVGVDLASDFVLSGFDALKACDPDGCRPFDRDRKGLTVGEAGAAIVLTRSDMAAERWGDLKGWGSSNDANHITGPSRDGSGLAMAIGRALRSAGLDPDHIDYLHAHATGTAYNDRMESLAFHKVFNGNTPEIGASKGAVGHTLGAAGVLESILCLMALRENTLPGIPGLDTPDDEAPRSLLKTSKAHPGLEHILKVNVGFGGINAALVWKKSR